MVSATKPAGMSSQDPVTTWIAIRITFNTLLPYARVCPRDSGKSWGEAALSGAIWYDRASTILSERREPPWENCIRSWRRKTASS